jgi:hypothetical protein
MADKRTPSSVLACLFSILTPIVLLLFILIPSLRPVFIAGTNSQPYVFGFFKFALLATVGEIIAGRITTGKFCFAKFVLVRALIWGIIGILITLLFPLFSAGVVAVQDKGLLFGKGSKALSAFLTSVVNNFTFGIAMMAFHRITDTMLELRAIGQKKVKIEDAVRAIDWTAFVKHIVLRTIPFFWIPAHTLTFLLPDQYRVFASAFLSIILGLLLAIGKRRSE